MSLAEIEIGGMIHNTLEQLPPPPRVIRHRRGKRWGLWIARLFILPHLVAGVWILWLILSGIIAAVAGTDMQGQVVRAWTEVSHGRHRASLQFKIDYTDGTPSAKLQTADVPEAWYNLLPINALNAGTVPPTVQVRVFELANVKLTALFLDSTLPVELAPSKIFFCMFWNGCVAIFGYFLYLFPRRIAKPYRIGHHTTGRIIKKESSGVRRTRYFVHSEFTTESGKRYETSQSIAQKDWEAIQVSQPVRILHLHWFPKWAVTYEFGEYDILDAKGNRIPAKSRAV